MTKRCLKLNFKALLLILIAIAIVAGVVSCKKRTQLPVNDFSTEIDEDTGLIGDDGNVITTITNYITNYITNKKFTTIFITNREYHTNWIIYKTNIINEKDITYTNYVYIEKVITNQIEIITNLTPDPKYYVSRWHNSFMYKVYAPFAGIGPEGEYKYTNVSYMDTDTLSALWKNMMKMKSYSGSRQELVIRNRGTGTYFYFDENADIIWSKNIIWNNKSDVILKKFVQGVIIRHICGNDTKGHYAIAGLYRLTKDTPELRNWNDTGVNILQGELFRWTRYAGEYDIIVLNPGHVVNGSEYGFEIYNTSGYDEFRYSQGGNGYYEQRPEVYMPKITHVTEAWKNWRPWELHDMSFKIIRR